MALYGGGFQPRPFGQESFWKSLGLRLKETEDNQWQEVGKLQVEEWVHRFRGERKNVDRLHDLQDGWCLLCGGCVCAHTGEAPVWKQGSVRSSWNWCHAKDFELHSEVSGKPLKILSKGVTGFSGHFEPHFQQSLDGKWPCQFLWDRWGGYGFNWSNQCWKPDIR